MDKIEQWLLDKRRKFSASMSSKLLSKGKNGELFGDGAWTYIKSMAVEMMTNVWDKGGNGDQVEAMLHGKVHEYPAYVHYIQETKNFQVKYFGDEHPIFIPHPAFPDEFGCSPDGGAITDEGTISVGLEIKCPYNPLFHYERLRWKDQWDILSDYPSCYAQIQAGLMCTGADEWHFVSYDERQTMRRFRAKIISVVADLKFQNNLEMRIRQAIKEKYRILSGYVGEEITNRAEYCAKIQSLL
jgi:YqaJ-like viral recombinase domain